MKCGCCGTEMEVADERVGAPRQCPKCKSITRPGSFYWEGLAPIRSYFDPDYLRSSAAACENSGQRNPWGRGLGGDRYARLAEHLRELADDMETREKTA